MKVISLKSLSLKEKIAQLIFVNGNCFDKRYLDLGVGGIFLDNCKSEKQYKDTISKYQNNSKIKLFVCTDMEGYWNPFKNFYKSTFFSNVKNEKEAHELGKEHGRILKRMGFNLNFSPIVEIRNNVWKGRTFIGKIKDIEKKIVNYIKGLKEEKIFATAKHYPGGSLVKDPHKFKFKTEIFKKDLDFFDLAIKNKVDFIMIGHPIVYGAVNSNGKQTTLSKEILSNLRKKFKGIIITDAITMMGLRISYILNFKKIYPDLIKAGNDVVLDSGFNCKYKRVLKGIMEIEKAVRNGKITEERINESVKRILKLKGYRIII